MHILCIALGGLGGPFQSIIFDHGREDVFWTKKITWYVDNNPEKESKLHTY